MCVILKMYLLIKEKIGLVDRIIVLFVVIDFIRIN